MANISEFKSALFGGGARPNQFYVSLFFPENLVWAWHGARAQFMCKAASLPSSTIGDIPVPYRGREIHVAGERTFQPWTVTIINDANFGLRNAFEEWHSSICKYASVGGKTEPFAYQKPVEVYQIDRNNTPIKTYQFVDAYPTNIGEITLNFGDNNTIEEFTVEFTYNYFTSSSSTDTDASGVAFNSSISTPIGTFPTPQIRIA